MLCVNKFQNSKRNINNKHSILRKLEKQKKHSKFFAYLFKSLKKNIVNISIKLLDW